MALRGNLKDFTLPDVFTLIAASKKTGVLRITNRGDAEGSVWFRDGDVFFAQSNWHHEKIGDRLVAAQKITPSALARALQIRAVEPAGRRIGQILVDEGYITPSVLEAFVQDQIQDTVFDLMRWDDGDFDFEILPEVVDEDIGLTVSIENIIMEGSRRLEEWARIKKKVPSMDIIFRMATAPGEGTYEISLKPAEWNLLLLIDGTRTVSELARATGRTDFEVARIVYGLFSTGLLEVTPEEEARRLMAEREELEARRAALKSLSAQPPAAGIPTAAAAKEVAQTVPPQESEAVVPPQPVEAPPAASAAPVEVPEFLAGAPSAPGPDDMVVFEEMLEALLPPTAPAPPREVEVESDGAVASGQMAPPAPLAPSAEPVAQVEEMLAEAVVEPSVEEAVAPSGTFAGPTEPAGTAEGFAQEEVLVEREVVDSVFVEPAPTIEPRVEPAAEPRVPFTTPGDLGVVLPEVLPAGVELEVEFEAEGQSELEIVPMLEPEAADEAWVEGSQWETPVEPVSVAFGETEVLEAGEAGLPTAPVAATSDETAPEAVVDGWQQLEAGVDEALETEILAELGIGEGANRGDLGLEARFAESAPADEPEEAAPRIEPVSEQPVDMGLAGAISDEIHALTGTKRARPAVVVGNLELGGQTLRRDAAIDRATLLKIIEGIRNL